jgi:cytoskeletal protein RodZ
MNKWIIAVVVVVILGAGGFFLANNSKDSANNTKTNTTSDTTTAPSHTPAKTNTDTSANTSQPAATTSTSFTINANDETADVKTLNVKKGDTIKVTFNVTQNETYHGGLEFRSDVVNSKPIKTGASDTVTFTADKSFDFVPYWYQSQIKKDYVISVKVQG